MIKRAISLVVVILGSAAAIPCHSQGQQNNPRCAYIYPAGGKQGTTFNVVISGQYLADASRVYVSGSGVEARVVEAPKPPKRNEVENLRSRLAELRKKERSPETQKEMAEITTKLDRFQWRRDAPAFADVALIEITIAPEAEPGERELRVLAPMGLSNPVVFCVGTFPEYCHTTATLEVDPETAKANLPWVEKVAAPLEPEMNVTVPSVLNGQLKRGARDRFRFTAKRGQRLVADVRARALIPYLADAVPGWFQATLSIYDGKGRELVYGDDYRFRPDPVVFCEIPADGEYVVEVKDAIFRGREDFVYRVILGELPFITGIFPVGCTAGSRATVDLMGWNLSTGRISFATSPDKTGVHPLSVQARGQVSNSVPFLVDKYPENAEKEPNNSSDASQLIKLPVVINGRIDVPDDKDVYQFSGKAGEVVVAEVEARRLASPCDSVLTLTDGQGKQIAFNDDYEDKGSGLNTHHADSYLTGTLPADGKYFVKIADTQHKGNAAYAYRLRVSPPEPDFELRVVPSTLNVRGGATAKLTVYALRRDGFDGPITVQIKDAPAGVKINGSGLAAKADQVPLTLTIPQDAPEEPFTVTLQASGTIGGKQVIRPVIPADDMMQAFAYKHLVVAKELKVAVADRFKGARMAKLLTPGPMKLPLGGTARVQIGLPQRGFWNRMQLDLTDGPDGIVIQEVNQIPEGAEIVFQCDNEKVVPGVKGNLIVSVLVAPGGGNAANPRRNERRINMGTLPAIPFEVVSVEDTQPKVTGTEQAMSEQPMTGQPAPVK